MKKNKIIFSLLFLVILSAWGLYFYLNKKNEENIYYANEKEAVLGKCAFELEIADTEELRKKGLSNRDELCPDCGMIFFFEKEGNYFFWMKDMRFPIDILWLKDGEVVDINQNVNHKSKSVYSTREKADKVLELNANEVERCEIKIGDKLKKRKNVN